MASQLFKSARLTYRDCRPGDIDVLHALYNDPEVQIGAMTKGIGPRHANFREEIERWTKTNPLYAIVAHTETGDVLGSTCLFENGQERGCNFAIQIRRDYWGHGYGKEIVAWVVQYGFRMMGLHRISLGVFESNARAMAVYKSVGFVQEGVLRKARFAFGKWEDIILMAIVEDDFFAREEAKAQDATV